MADIYFYECLPSQEMFHGFLANNMTSLQRINKVRMKTEREGDGPGWCNICFHILYGREDK
jgi:hypothetical protein